MSGKKIWFVTGASSGFGRLWTQAALKRGDSVAATALRADDLEDLASAYGDLVLPMSLDVTDRAAVFDVVSAAHAHFGRLDVVLSNAGYGYMGAIEELDFDEFRRNFDTNLFAALSVFQAAVPILRAQAGGHILAVTSIGGLVSSPTGGSYTASKWALEGMTEAFAQEVGPLGIHVTIIEPGPYSTNFHSSAKTAPTMPQYDKVREATNAQFSSDRAGDPEATGDAILALVDAKHPPLRLLLGSTPLPVIRRTYEERLRVWEEWKEVSDAAQNVPAD